MNSVFSLPDPRAFATDAHDVATSNPILKRAIEALATEQSVVQQRLDDEIVAEMTAAIARNATDTIQSALDAAPSLAVLRHLTRRLADAHVGAGRIDGDDGLPRSVFAIPIVIVAGSAAPAQIPGAVPDVGELIGIMKAHGALRGNQSFVLSNSLTSAATFALSALTPTLDWWRGAPGAPAAVPPSRMNVPAGQETAFLRFMIGTAVAGPNVNLFTERELGAWGMPFTQALSKQLTAPNLTVLAMPRPAAIPLAALLVGQTAQREVALQLFAANAIRKFREKVGEPNAVISAHRTADGGEVRLSLSNPFDEKGAEGFRAVLHANERAQDVAQNMRELMEMCKVEDVLTLADIYPDAEPNTGMTLFFKPESIADAPALRMH